MIGRIQYRVRKARCLVTQCKQQLILVWKYSRFARNRGDSIAFKAMLRKAGVPVISITEPFEDTPTDRLLEAMIESLDEFYPVNLGEEVTRGMRERTLWWAIVGSNHRPQSYQDCALTN